VHDSQIAEAVLMTPKPALEVTRDKAYDSEKSTPDDQGRWRSAGIPSKGNARKDA